MLASLPPCRSLDSSRLGRGCRLRPLRSLQTSAPWLTRSASALGLPEESGLPLRAAPARKPATTRAARPRRCRGAPAGLAAGVVAARGSAARRDAAASPSVMKSWSSSHGGSLSSDFAHGLKLAVVSCTPAQKGESAYSAGREASTATLSWKVCGPASSSSSSTSLPSTSFFLAKSEAWSEDQRLLVVGFTSSMVKSYSSLVSVPKKCESSPSVSGTAAPPR
mmetsp:Transcript_10909/g.34623  ORF Transcript_10909/g.34623 Transcript_10909/m.34623 type:complete len:222 (+) Transcript_10909:206-871(+)